MFKTKLTEKEQELLSFVTLLVNHPKTEIVTKDKFYYIHNADLHYTLGLSNKGLFISNSIFSTKSSERDVVVEKCVKIIESKLTERVLHLKSILENKELELITKAKTHLEKETNK